MVVNIMEKKKTWQFITGFETKEEAIKQKEVMKKKGWWSEKDEDYKIILEQIN